MRTEASEIRHEASELLNLLSAGMDRPRYAMGERVSVAMRIARIGEEGNQYLIEVLCHAHGSVDPGWSDYSVVLTDNRGQDHKLELNRHGRASVAEEAGGNIVLTGARIVPTLPVVQPIKNPKQVGQPLRQAALVAARTDVGQLFTETITELLSDDGRVAATVTCSAGGGLGVRFVAARAPDLVGAHVRFRFFTDAGRELSGEVRLWPADEQADQLVAFAERNQTALAPVESFDTSGHAQKVNLSFEFEVHPNGEARIR